MPQLHVAAQMPSSWCSAKGGCTSREISGIIKDNFQLEFGIFVKITVKEITDEPYRFVS